MELTKRQTEIIDAALRLTAEGGIQNLTIKNLADALGITEPAIYRHFKNKSEIVKTMIGSFESATATGSGLSGFDAITEFARSRFAQVAANPPLARVMFAEELFMDDREFSELMLGMMHKHKNSLEKHFIEAQAGGEVRRDISLDMLFRLVFGPVRLLVKQWGISGGAFPLTEKGKELLEDLRKILK